MISLPWPPAKLSPNARTHWASKAKAFRQYKFQCAMLLSMHRDSIKGRDAYNLRFCPPDARRRDLDNMLSSFKAGIDALAEVSGIDDSNFSFALAKGEPVKGGEIQVIA